MTNFGTINIADITTPIMTFLFMMILIYEYIYFCNNVSKLFGDLPLQFLDEWNNNSIRKFYNMFLNNFKYRHGRGKHNYYGRSMLNIS